MSTAAPPVPPTPATPPPVAPTLPTPAPVEPPPLGSNDDFRIRMANSLGKVVGPDGAISDLPPAAPEPPPVRKPVIHTATLGDQLEEEERVRKMRENGQLPPEPVAAPAPPAQTAPPVVPTPAPPSPRLVKKPDPVPPTPPAPLPVLPSPVVAPVVQVTPPADPDASFISQLDEDQRAEIATAEFAEKKFPEMKGKKAETLQYYKKVDEFAVAHPEATTEELDQFMATNRPKWKPGEKRRVVDEQTSEKIDERVARHIEESLAPKLKAAEHRIKTQEVTPVIDRAVNDFSALVSSSDAVIPDAGMEPMPTEVAKRIAEVGYAKAAEEYAVEAPVYQSSMNAAREWLNLSNGLVNFNQSNPLHSWLFDFVEKQGKIYAQNPASTLDGKRFVPMTTFFNLAQTNPESAKMCYTFNDKDVMNLLAVNANISYNEKVKALERSGFTRAKKTATPVHANPPPPSAVTAPLPVSPSTTSPISKPNALPGAASVAPNVSAIDPLIASIDPDAARRLGLA